ncbi:MAG TPA: cupredoxin family copper-binding protein [bacterium]|nr:cupredoxin family copper-binding protein [bacterium]
MAGSIGFCSRFAVCAAGIVAAALSLPAAAVGVPGTPALATAATAAVRPIQIRVKNFAFDPPAITVKAGQTLSWTNDDVVPHTATADGKTWDSGQMAPGRSYTVTVTKPGTYGYTCSNHPFMHAKVIVTK